MSQCLWSQGYREGRPDMERRTSIRRGARVTAYICREGRSRVRTQARDLSAEGAFLCTDGNQVHPGELVALVFTLEFDRVVRTYRRWARVAHCREDGIGVQLYRQRPEEACSASRA